MKSVKQFAASLLSRKLLVAAGSAAALAYERQWYPATAVVVAYVASQAHVDARTVAGVAADVVKAAPAAAAAAEAAIPAAAPEIKAVETVAVDAAQAVEATPAVTSGGSLEDDIKAIVARAKQA